jgi:SAM-dependent methyltransferase
MVAAKSPSYWDGFAQAFANLGSPLRPAVADIQFLEDTIAAWASNHQVPRLCGTMLGVTPELAKMHWPEGSQLLAVDKSMPMAKTAWPGNLPGRRAVVCGNWLALPRGAASCHVVAGDGSINCLRYPDEFLTLGESVARVLTEDGILVLRCYLQSNTPEDPADVYSDLLTGAVQSFHAFKLRLLMATQKSVGEGVALRDVWASWEKRNLDRAGLFVRYDRPAVETIEYYRNSSTVYAFPTLAELRQVLHPVFEELRLLTPDYELGDRCPTLVLKPWRNRVPIV